ncbi:hypothetical protein ABEB36_004264 [Hypothenemus hampei]|uniref:Odorant receptor n=1 Tax=Hypothenemus hampei TaxID=57062 RepID=A0ABD1F2R9_HYPHA
MSVEYKKSFLGLVRPLILVAGFWPLPLTYQKCYNIYSIIVKFSFLICLITILYEMLHILQHHYDLNIIITTFGMVITVGKMLIKLSIYHKFNTWALLKQVVEKDEEIKKSDDENVKASYLKKIQLINIYVTILVMITAVGQIGICTSGYLKFLQYKQESQLTNSTKKQYLMFKSLFPHQMDNYYYVLTFQLYWAWIIGLINTITTVLFLALLVYARFLLEGLQIYSGKFIIDLLANQKGKNNIETFKKFLDRHCYVIEFVQDLNQHLKYITLLQFIFDSVDLASILSTTEFKSGLENLWLYFYVIILIIQIYLLGWNCNEITVQSIQLAETLYDTNWYLLSREDLFNLQFIIARAQKPLFMTIGPFSPMTTSSVITIWKTAFSYYTIMN